MPRVYVWDKDTNSIDTILVPIEDGVITRDHIESVESKDSRIMAFVESLAKDSSEVSISFKININHLLAAVHSQSIHTKVKEATDDDVD
jgi:hypothetical protein